MEDFNTYNKAWIKRALNPNTPTTVAKETLKTSSREYNGKFYNTLMAKGVRIRDTATRLAEDSTPF